MIAKSRVKLILGIILFGCLLALLYGTLTGLGALITYFNSGADPESALKLIPSAPADLEDRLIWLDDYPTGAEGRLIAPFTREEIAGAYLNAWAQWGIAYELQQPYGLKTYFTRPALDAVSSAITATVAAGWRIRQSNLHHTLQLAFYADDGAMVAFTDHEAHLVQQILPADGRVGHINESTSVYDVVMLLEDGNWRIHDLVRRGNGPPLRVERPDQAAVADGFVRVQGNELRLNGQPYQVAGINYYPQASPWTQFWPEYDPGETKVDLDLIRQLGLNSVRIFISYVDFGGDKVDLVNVAKLRHFLDQAQAHELKVIVTLFDHHTDHAVAQWAADDRHLAGFIPQFADHPAILAWDIKNEANRDYGLNTPELTDAWLRHIANTVRRHDPNHLLTAGWSTPEAAATLTDVLDFISFHYFEESADYSARLEKLIAAAPDKPVVLQEFVMSNWNPYWWPHGHTEAEQALYYADLLSQHRNYDTAGYMVWTLHDFDSVPLAEFSLPWQQATQANMGLRRGDGSWKPAAALIRPDAPLDELPPLPRWQRFTKPFWRTVMASALVMLGLLWWFWRKWGRRIVTLGYARYRGDSANKDREEIGD